jgi:hypothetical protein
MAEEEPVPTFAAEAVRILQKAPRDDAMEATGPAKAEAQKMAKRAESFQSKTPDKALAVWLEALDLDPSCKQAYEGIAKAVLVHADGDKAALDATLRTLAVGIKRNPSEGTLKDLEKKLKALLPAKSGEQASKQTGKPQFQVLTASSAKAPGGICQYCKSPIPKGSSNCRSCQLSGELPVPRVEDDGPAPPDKPLSAGTIVAFVVLVFLVGAGVVWVAFLRAPKTGSSETKKP